MRLAWREGERVPARLKLRVLPDTPRARRSFFTLKLANLAKRFQKFPKCAIVCQWFVNFLPNINKIPSNVRQKYRCWWNVSKISFKSGNFTENVRNVAKSSRKLETFTFSLIKVGQYCRSWKKSKMRLSSFFSLFFLWKLAFRYV